VVRRAAEVDRADAPAWVADSDAGQRAQAAGGVSDWSYGLVRQPGRIAVHVRAAWPDQARTDADIRGHETSDNQGGGIVITVRRHPIAQMNIAISGRESILRRY